MAYQVLNDFYLMGPRGKYGAYNFAMKRGFIFDCQRKYRPFFDAFIIRGRLRRVGSEPTHIFKEGDFRPIKSVSDNSLKPKIQNLFKTTPLEEMTKSWLGNQRKDRLVQISKQLNLPTDNKTKDQLIRLILTKKEETLNPLPEIQNPSTTIPSDVPKEAIVAYGEEDKII